MLFNSIDFAVFLPIVFTLYWTLAKTRLSYQNVLLLVASYFFYASWDYRFLFLLIFSTLLDFYTGIKMHQAVKPASRRFWFWTSVIINLGFLGVFKYYNFFIVTFSQALSTWGLNPSISVLNVILPVGISFYTFHGLSYVIDIYKRRIEPERNIISYSLFVSYFPLLVAGPIERATHLLPQIKQARQFNYHLAVQGAKQIVWGLFKKVVVADNCAFFVNSLFIDSHNYSGPELWTGMIFFAFQIYCDFSGYSDIAIGTSKLFGIELLRNFNFPYFSKDIADFWRRWHISLSTWFRDYVYIPLGGSKASKLIRVRNTFVIFLVSGFWHGANWTFIVWGAIHALLFLPLLIFDKNRSSLESTSYQIRDAFKIVLNFLFVCFAWVFFRAASLTEALHYIGGMFNSEHPSLHFFYKTSKHFLLACISVIAILFLIFYEWRSVKNNNFEIQLSKRSILVIIALIFFMGSFKNQMSFIYFQF